MVKSPKPVKKKISPTTGVTFNWYSPVLIVPVLALITFLVFADCFDFEVTNWDDNHYIRELLLIRSLSWDNIVLIFKTKVLLSYNPLVILSYAVDYAAGSDSAGWYHGTNVWLHVANSILVFFVFRHLLQNPATAALIAFLFALHPLHVESVAWIASRKDVLFMFFFLLSWWSYMVYADRERPAYGWYVISILLFLCSAFSKIQAITLPVVLLLCDYLRNQTFTRRQWLDKLPFLIGSISFGWAAITTSSLQADKYAVPVGFMTRVIYSFQAYFLYVIKCVLPFRQNAIYGFPIEGSTDFWLYLTGGILLAAATVFFILRWWKRSPLAAFGLTFFAINIFPTLHVVALNSSVIYERFSYVSYLGLFLLLCMAVSGRKPWTMVVWISLLPLAVLAHQRVAVWKGNATLWTDIIEKNPRSHEAYNNRGSYYNERGDLDRALEDFNASLTINTRQPRAYNNRSMIWFRKKEYAKALQDVDSSISQEPFLAEAWCNKGNVYFDLKQYDTAVVYYSKALELMPNFPATYSNRGSAYLKMGDFEKAKADYEVSMQQAPGFVDAWRLGALAYAELDMHDQARAAMNQALSLSPGCDAMQILSNEYWEMGRRTWAGKDENLDKAIRYYQLSAEISPTNAQAWINLGGMYYVKKDLVNARTYWKKALQCKPNDEEALLWLNRTGGVQ